MAKRKKAVRTTSKTEKPESHVLIPWLDDLCKRAGANENLTGKARQEWLAKYIEALLFEDPSSAFDINQIKYWRHCPCCYGSYGGKGIRTSHTHMGAIQRRYYKCDQCGWRWSVDIHTSKLPDIRRINWGTEGEE